MKNELLDRRCFLKTVAGAAAMGLSARAIAAAEEAARKAAAMVRLGGPIFHPPKDPE
jgi:hypothetical protein